MRNNVCDYCLGIQAPFAYIECGGELQFNKYIAYLKKGDSKGRVRGAATMELRIAQRSLSVPLSPYHAIEGCHFGWCCSV